LEKSLEELNNASKVAGSLSPRPISVIKGGSATAAASTAAESNKAVKAVPRPLSDFRPLPLLDPPECGLLAGEGEEPLPPVMSRSATDDKS
jgi:hypothetical protein